MKEQEGLPCDPVWLVADRHPPPDPQVPEEGITFPSSLLLPLPSYCFLSQGLLIETHLLSPVFSGAVLLEEAGNAHTRSCGSAQEHLPERSCAWKRPGCS